jgi:translation initiation factor 1
MSREKPRKIDVNARPAPALQNPFAALGQLEALQNLPAAPERSPTAPAPPAAASAQAPAPPRKHRGRLILRRETKERGGKTVVVISGFAEGVPGASAVLIGDLAKELKGKLGCGGTFDRQEITLQGDRAAQVAALLEQLGFAVRGVTS